jgi:hypothetical protein
MLCKISDLLVQISTTGNMPQRCKEYLTQTKDNSADIIIRADLYNFNRWPELSENDAIYMESSAQFYFNLLFFNGMMLHSSCVVVDGKAYLFSAPSGVGKSTHVKLWLSFLKDRAFILNDDKPALRIVDSEVRAYGTPWSGTEDISVNSGYPVGGIAVLKRGEENSIRSLTPQEAFFDLVDQSHRSLTGNARDRFFKILDHILRNVKLYELKCNMDISAALLSYATMTGNEVSL